ncbi:MAG TPA: zinc ribbon domain-containing protein [Abditibacterium sp.]|jgi:hypothetical protein
MNPPPLAQPSAQTCPQCGAALDSTPNFCPNCGAALGASDHGSAAWTIVLQILLGLGAVGIGAFGACFILVGGIGLSSSSFSEGAPMIGIGAVALGIAAACIWGIIRLNRRGR